MICSVILVTVFELKSLFHAHFRINTLRKRIKLHYTPHLFQYSPSTIVMALT